MYYEALLTDTTLYPIPVGELFNWSADVDGDSWSVLPSLGSEQILKQPGGNGDNGYNHIPEFGRHPLTGAIFIMYQVHDYDEEAPGMFTEHVYSTNGGTSWTSPITLVGQQSDMLRRDENSGRVAKPMGYYTAGGQFYAVIDVNDRDFTGGGNVRTGVGMLFIPISGDGTKSELIQWFHNGEGGSEVVAPLPVSGYPAYTFNLAARDPLFSSIYYSGANNLPRVNFSAQNYFLNFADIPTYGIISEPQGIKPDRSPEEYIYYKNAETDPGDGYKLFTQDYTNYYVSTIPDCMNNSAIVTRFLQVSDDLILISGNDQQGNRTRLFLAFARRNGSTGKYDITNSDVYVIREDLDTTPDFEGDGKGGGPQSVDILLVGDILHITYSPKKEYIIYRNVDISALI